MKRELCYGAIACVLLALPLAGCVTKVNVTPRVAAPTLPPIPARLNGCFKTLTPIPVQRMSGKQLTLLLSIVRQSEARKTRCGRDLIQWYARVRRSYGPK